MVLARDPHSASLWPACVFRDLWHLNGIIRFPKRAQAIQVNYRSQLICGTIDALQLLLITPQHNISAIETFKCVFVIILRCNSGDIKIGFWWAAGASIG